MAGIDGTWNIQTKTPMGDRKGTLTIVRAGDRVTGQFSNDLGVSDINEGTVSGDTIRCSVQVTQPMPLRLQIEATVNGNSISGAVQIPGLGNCPLSGTRA